LLLALGEDAGDLQLDDEGRGDGVGGGQQTNENVPVKSVKEISFDHQMTQILLSLHTSMQQRRRNIFELNKMNLSLFLDWFQQMTSSTSTFSSYKCFHSFLNQITSTVLLLQFYSCHLGFP
jgi:hypothetical protein